ncbi:MAG TPA: transposase [Terriglobales bacterium]
MEQFQPPDSAQASAADIPPASSPTQTQSGDGVLRTELKRAFGIDLTQIPGIHTGIAPTLFGEIGSDFTKFRGASALASWMGLCPDNEISGGKVLWAGTRKVNGRAATALRMAAPWLHHSKSVLGDFYRRMRARLGAPKAITAAAPKLARIIFPLVTPHQEFDARHFAADQIRFHKRQEAKFRAQARALGFQLIPLEQTA